jgi:type IV pilus assembly protein PilM
MGLLEQLASFVEDPAPAYAFELSGAGIAWTSRPQSKKESPQFGFRAFEPGVLNVSPMADNVAQPEVLLHEVASLGTPQGKKRKDAALILPDYCARVAVLDFESFPAAREEQLSLVRFRLKKTVPFDVDSAAVNFHAQKSGKMTEVVVAAAAHEIIARYEAPFRANGFNPGFVTTSILASLDLLPAQGLQVLLKLAGRVLTVAVCDGRMPKLVRCVELPDLSVDEVKAVLFPTLAYAEDMLGRHPETLYAVGLGDAAAEATSEWGLPIHSLRSPWAAANETNSGLLGWLQAQEAA